MDCFYQTWGKSLLILCPKYINEQLPDFIIRTKDMVTLALQFNYNKK